MSEQEPKGYSYHVTDEQLREYATWSTERRLAWLTEGAKLRRALPKAIRDKQDAFRRGEI
jgi:hypothetical protein